MIVAADSVANTPMGTRPTAMTKARNRDRILFFIEIPPFEVVYVIAQRRKAGMIRLSQTKKRMLCCIRFCL
jgi:hypothetical protein